MDELEIENDLVNYRGDSRLHRDVYGVQVRVDACDWDHTFEHVN